MYGAPSDEQEKGQGRGQVAKTLIRPFTVFSSRSCAFLAHQARFRYKIDHRTIGTMTPCFEASSPETDAKTIHPRDQRSQLSTGISARKSILSWNVIQLQGGHARQPNRRSARRLQKLCTSILAYLQHFGWNIRREIIAMALLNMKLHVKGEVTIYDDTEHCNVESGSGSSKRSLSLFSLKEALLAERFWERPVEERERSEAAVSLKPVYPVLSDSEHQPRLLHERGYPQSR